VSCSIVHFDESTEHALAVGVLPINTARGKLVELVICMAAKVLGDTRDLSDTYAMPSYD
jgi:hypothetical protein